MRIVVDLQRAGVEPRVNRRGANAMAMSAEQTQRTVQAYANAKKPPARHARYTVLTAPITSVSAFLASPNSIVVLGL